MSSGAPAHPLGAPDAIEDSTWAGVERALRMISQDSNGDDTYSNERALVGHLEAKYNLIVDEVTHNHYDGSNHIEVDLIKFGKTNGVSDYIGNGSGKAPHIAAHSYMSMYANNEPVRRLWINKLCALNYVAMREAGLKSASAFVVAALRARWIATGAYGVVKSDTSSTYDEVTIVSDTTPMYGRVVSTTSLRDLINSLGKYSKDFMAAYKNEKYGMKWVVKHAENIWAAVEHCFRVRNHHFKSDPNFLASYVDLYIRFLKAAYEGEFEWPEEVDFLDVFRTAIHPFKIKALPVMLVHYLVYGKIANAAIIRTSGSPVGNAQITTTAAALDTMSSEIWWNSFNQVYSDAIAKVRVFSNQINDNKYAYHLSASLYGVTKANTVRHDNVDYSMDVAKGITSLLASACQGLIDALKAAKDTGIISRFALENAKALDKPASSNPLLRIRVKTLIEAAIDSISDADNLPKAINSALPALLEADDGKSPEGVG